MKIRVTDARPLTEENDGLMITLNHLAGLSILAGTEKLGDKNLLVQNDTLFVKFTDGYLAIKPSTHTDMEKHFWVDNDLKPLPGLFSIDLDEVKQIVNALEEILLRIGSIKPYQF